MSATNVRFYLMLPGGKGDKSARLQLNTRRIMEAAGQVARGM